MSVETVARFTISLAVNVDQLRTYRASQDNRLKMVAELDENIWPLTDNEKVFLQLGNFEEIFKYLDESGPRGINTIQI